MSTDIKQAIHVEAGKSFGTSEANENERRWDEDKIDRKNQDPTNHYDKTRMKLNFEIGPDGKIHPLGYQKKSLEVRLQERLAELGWKPFKPDSKIQPNCGRRNSGKTVMSMDGFLERCTPHSMKRSVANMDWNVVTVLTGTMCSICTSASISAN